jgi:hypothetical protein
MIGDGDVTQVPGGVPPESALRVLALVLYQIRLTSSSGAIAAARSNRMMGICEQDYLIERMWGSSLVASSGLRGVHVHVS